MAPLQSLADEPGWLLAAFQASDVLSALLGLFIAYLAYQGYRRNDSRPMLFVAAGFALALGAPLALLFVSYVAPGLPQVPLAAVSQGCEVGGLLCIVYGLRL